MVGTWYFCEVFDVVNSAHFAPVCLCKIGVIFQLSDAKGRDFVSTNLQWDTRLLSAQAAQEQRLLL